MIEFYKNTFIPFLEKIGNLTFSLSEIIVYFAIILVLVLIYLLIKQKPPLMDVCDGCHKFYYEEELTFINGKLICHKCSSN
jgi:hypothetical protein